ncbi:MAG TPA: hypothetical protein VMR52_13705 [Dehalococcoidia bacterium]|nr:hypothetical protein [Dehalococcoidia bacterium]
MPSFRDFFTNLRADMPLTRKVQRLVANNLIKLRSRRDCCGNHGEPGC